MELDFTPYLIEALMSKQELRKDIISVYRKNKYYYYSLAKESPHYEHPAITQGDVYFQESARRLLGILLSGTKSEKGSRYVFELIKKAFPIVYNYIIKTEEIDLGDLIKKFYYDEMSDDEFNGNLMVAYFFALHVGKPIKKDEVLNRFLKYLHNREKYYKLGYLNKFSHLPVKDKKKAVHVINRVEDYLNISLDNPWFFLNIEDEELRLFMELLYNIFDQEGLSLVTLFQDTELKKEDYLDLATIYWCYNKNLNREKASQFLITGTILKKLLKVFNSTKEYYFANNKETVLVEMTRLKEKIDSLKQQVQFKNGQIKKAQLENTRLRENYKDSLEATINKQNKKMLELKKELHEEKSKNKELFALRKLMFSLESEGPEVVEEEIKLPDVDAIIFGGHERWQARLKNLLPQTFVFIGADQHNFDTRLLHNTEYVFINTNYMSHSLYYRIVENLPDSTKLNFITGGIERSLSKINKAIKERRN